MNPAHIALSTSPLTRRARVLRAARRSHRALLPIFLGSCALPAIQAHAQTPPTQAATPPANPAGKLRATAAKTPAIVLPATTARATAPTVDAPRAGEMSIREQNRIAVQAASANTANSTATPSIIPQVDGAAKAASARSANSTVAPSMILRLGSVTKAASSVGASSVATSSATASSATASSATSPSDGAKIIVRANAQLTPPATINTSVRIAQLRPKDTEAPATPPETGPEGLKVPVGPEIPNNGTPGAPPPDTSTAPPRVTPAPGAPILDTTPEPPALVGNVTAAEGREISEVRVVGSRVVPADTILAQVKLQRGAAFSSRQAQLDLARIEQLGFFATTQAQVAPDLSDPNKIVLTYIVVENRVITGFEFANNSALKAEEITPILTSKVGTVLNRNSIRADVTAIQKLYSDKGFAVVVQDAQQTNEGKLVFNFSEAVISKVNVVGLKKTRESLVRSQIRIKPGDTFSAAKMRQDLNRLYDTNFFDSVDPRVDDDPTQSGAVIVNFVFREKRTGQFQVGVGFDSRSKLSGFLTLSESNLRGSGQRGFASVEAGSQRNFELGTGNPFIGPKNASYDVSVYRRSIFRQPNSLQRLLVNVTNPDGTITDSQGNTIVIPSNGTLQEQRTGGRINFTKPLDYDRRRTLIFGYRNENAKARITSFNSDSLTPTEVNNLADISPLLSSGTVSAASVGFLRDSRDLRIDPSSGGRESIVLEQAFKLLGGNLNFTKLDLDLRRYFPIIRGERLGAPAKLVFAGRVVLGRSVNQLPIFEQYYIGGTDTVRGYNTEQQYGDNQLYGNAELRYRFQQKITGVLFADSGTAYGGNFSSGRDINLLSSFGVGVRLVTPIGPIRLDYGIGRDGGRTHFGIGSTF